MKYKPAHTLRDYMSKLAETLCQLLYPWSTQAQPLQPLFLSPFAAEGPHKTDAVSAWIAQDTLRTDAISRKHLERFLEENGLHVYNEPGVYCFRAQVTFCVKNEFVRETVDTEIYVGNNTGHVRLHESRLAARHGFPEAYNTRSHIMKTNHKTIIIMGEPGEDIVLWLRLE